MRVAETLGGLGAGEAVVATDARGFEVRGRIDVAAPELGVLWVWEFGTGARRLLHAAEHNFAPATG